MTDLNKQALGGLLRLFIGLSLALFVPAWTFDYWQAWVFLAVFFAPILAITLYVMRNDPKLLARRIKAGPRAEKEKSQKIIQIVAGISFIALILVPAIDHRFGWSAVPPSGVAAGDILVALGLLLIFFVFKENSFASAVIEISAGQRVISTGPYGLVRHPMYSAALVMFLGAPPALGSWWGLFASVPIALVLVWRLIDEEKFLVKSLPGYSDYRDKVKYRLVPFIW